jgi:subtilase family protein
MHCDSLKQPVAQRAARAAAVSPPYAPSDLQDAYELAGMASTAGSDQTVAIVDAYDDPSAESDLAYYRAHFGLPPCTTANGCFSKVDQNGGTSYPAPDANWAGEIALDLDMVSAICPHCKILLVEADSASGSDLFTAIGTAVSLGATQVSNSWGGGEFKGEGIVDPSLSHPGVAITVSSGDDGYGVEYPAASAFVTAVGGTSLAPSSNTRGWDETAWGGAGSGCSLYIPKPSWQHDASCPGRTVADVSAVADPNTGVLSYDTYQSGGDWWQVGGTSAAAPIVAAAYALVGSSASAGGFAYANPTWFNDVSSGSNGSCIFTYLCTAVTGFDGPTGMGTPNLSQAGGPASPVAPGGGETTTTPAPVNPAPPTPPPAPVPVQPLLSSIAVAGAGTTVSRSGRVKVRLTCAASRPRCAGRLKLQLALSHGRVVTVGSRRYSIAAGRRAYISVRLSRYGLSQLRKHHRLRIYATALDSDGTAAQSSFIARAPKHKRRVKHPTRR